MHPRLSGSLRPADGPHLAATATAAKEPIPAIGLEPRNAYTSGHLQTLQHFSGLRINPPHIALLAFHGGVPELSVDPADTGDESVGLDGAENSPSFRIDLTDLPVPVLSHPKRPFGPRESRVAALTRRWDGREHATRFWINFLNAIFRKLIQVHTVERRSSVRDHVDGAKGLPCRRIKDG